MSLISSFLSELAPQFSLNPSRCRDDRDHRKEVWNLSVLRHWPSIFFHWNFQHLYGESRLYWCRQIAWELYFAVISCSEDSQVTHVELGSEFACLMRMKWSMVLGHFPLEWSIASFHLSAIEFAFAVVEWASPAPLNHEFASYRAMIFVREVKLAPTMSHRLTRWKCDASRFVLAMAPFVVMKCMCLKLNKNFVIRLWGIFESFCDVKFLIEKSSVKSRENMNFLLSKRIFEH